MDLKTFVAETLSEIAEGVAEAQKRCAALGARVNPNIRGNWPASHADIWADDTSAPAQLVYFDVALSATEGSGKKGGAGVTVASVFSAGRSAESQGERSASSRIKFYVPLVLPAEPRDNT
jgi:hypothetical protein